MAKLVCQTGPHAGHEYALRKERSSFGRQRTCDVQILDSMASREHFVVRQDGKLWTVVDLESRNGTKVNDKKISERQLDFGDRIRVGEVEYLFVKEPGDIELKDLLSKYEIIEKIGEGGMGVVYKALQRSMDRTVALKILAPKYSSRPRFIESFITEARAAGRLNHPNIIQVHDVGAENEVHYFSMEFVDGETCMQRLRRDGPFPLAESLEIARQTAKALDYAHNNRLIHADIKPENIMLGSGGLVKVADLGISKTFDEAEAQGKPKRIVGTPHYMSPEAALGQKIDHRIDIYSLGATLYHLLAGQTPFQGTTATDLLKQHISKPPKPLADIESAIPQPISDLIAEMMAKKPEQRPTDASAIVERLTDLQARYGDEETASGAPGAETLILRRFAAGEQTAEPPVKAKPSPALQRRGPGTAGVGTGSRDRTRAGKNGGGNLAGMVSTVLILAILAAGGLLAYMNRSAIAQSLGLSDPPAPPPDADPDDTPDPPDDPTPPPTNPVRRPPGDPTDWGNQVNQRTPEETIRLRDQQLRALDDLERTLSSPTVNLDRALDELLPIEQDPANDMVAGRAANLRRVLDRRIAEQEAEAELQELNALMGEVDAFVSQRDYEAAERLLRSYQRTGRSDGALQRIDMRLASVADDRDTYLRNLRERIEAANSVRQLTAIRDELPPSLLGSELEARIEEQLQTALAAAAAEQQQYVEQAREALGTWDLDRVHRIHADRRGDMGEASFGNDLDDINRIALRLEGMVQDLNHALTTRSRPPRYDGILHGRRDVDLISASPDGLLVRGEDGSDMNIPWRLLSVQEFERIFALSFGRRDLPTQRDVISAWAQATGQE